MLIESRLRPAKAMAWLMLLALVALALGLGLREPSPPDEPRFALAARHMVESGQWLVPHRGTELYADKPAPFMWLQAIGYSITGNLRIAFLLPSLLAGLLTLWLTYDLGRRLWRPRIGVYAACALFVCLQFGLQAKRAQIDMVLVAFTTLSLWGLLRHLLRGPDRRALLIGAFAAGVGTVTKGVGFLPLLVFLPWLLVQRGLDGAVVRHRPSAALWQVPSAFALGTSLWLAPVLIAVLGSSDPALHDYAREILFRQTAQRYTDAWHHVKPVWYYLPVILTLWLPGALLLPWLLPAWVRRLRRRDARQMLLLGWVVLVLAFFSASAGKREVYLLPALPAICLAAAPLLPALLRRIAARRVLLGYVLVLSSAALLLAGSELIGAGHWLQRQASTRGLSADELRSLQVWLAVLGAGGLSLAVLLRVRRAAPAVIAFTALLWSVYGLGLLPALDASSSARGLMQRVGQHIGPDAELGLLAWREQHLLQADRPAKDFGFNRDWHEQWADAGAWLAAAPERRWLFVLEQALSPCVDRRQAIAIGRSNRRDWLLLPASAWPAGCVTEKFEREERSDDSR